MNSSENIQMRYQSKIRDSKQLGFLLPILFMCVAATGYTWAQAWVKKVVPISKLNSAIATGYLKNKLSLVLLSKDSMVITPVNGNRYLKFYLLNNMDSVATIGRSDAALPGISSEVLKNNKWQLFQEGIGSGCGNSYWSQKLASKQALLVEYDHAETGPIKILFRLKMTQGKRVLLSNVITVDIDSVSYKRIADK